MCRFYSWAFFSFVRINMASSPNISEKALLRKKYQLLFYWKRKVCFLPVYALYGIAAGWKDKV